MVMNQRNARSLGLGLNFSPKKESSINNNLDVFET
jgi:hypothetical protein